MGRCDLAALCTCKAVLNLSLDPNQTAASNQLLQQVHNKPDGARLRHRHGLPGQSGQYKASSPAAVGTSACVMLAARATSASMIRATVAPVITMPVALRKPSHSRHASMQSLATCTSACSAAGGHCCLPEPPDQSLVVKVQVMVSSCKSAVSCNQRW